METKLRMVIKLRTKRDLEFEMAAVTATYSKNEKDIGYMNKTAPIIAQANSTEKDTEPKTESATTKQT